MLPPTSFNLALLVDVKLAVQRAVNLGSLVRKDYTALETVDQHLVIPSWYYMALNEAVDLACHLAVDLALLRVGNGVSLTAHNAISNS